MKFSIMYCLAILIPMATASCATNKGASSGCSTLNIIYTDNVLGAHGVREGRFLVTNTGKLPVKLPLEWKTRHHIHTQYATPEERSSSGGSWRIFNPVLEEVMGWSGHMTIKPGQEEKIAYGANGLFDDGPPLPENMEYSIVIMDLAGCSYRSEPFKR